MDFYKDFLKWEDNMIISIDGFTPERIPKPIHRVSFKQYIRMPQKRVQNSLFLHKPTRYAQQRVVEVEVL